MKTSYRWYVLILLTVVYAVNFLDRQIISILAPYIKADLDIGDSQIGLLYGTAFALFYAIFGIPLAKLADGWDRVRTLAGGLILWSVMTAFSGFSGNFGQLAAARVGVGLGEATTGPAGVSLLCDYFPKRQRATALSIYTSGHFIGAGSALLVGGLIVHWWQSRFGPAGTTAPLGLSAWQAAFLIVGLPGVLLALIVMTTVREPVRGALDGVPYKGDPHAFRSMMKEAASLFPPWSLIGLWRIDSGLGRSNLLWLAAISAVASLIANLSAHLTFATKHPPVGSVAGITITSNFLQWSVVAIGAYAMVSWIQSVSRVDRAAHSLMLGSPTFRAAVLTCGAWGIVTYSLNSFMFIYASRYLDFVATDGLTLGIVGAASGVIGVTMSGFLLDAAKRRHPAGRVYLTAVVMACFILLAAIQYTTSDRTSFLVTFSLCTMCLTLFAGGMAATVQDIVIPRLRGRSFAMTTVSANLIGLGLGPYGVGLVSDVTGDLRFALLSVISIMTIVVAGLLYIAFRLPGQESSLIERAQAAGEPIAL